VVGFRESDFGRVPCDDRRGRKSDNPPSCSVFPTLRIAMRHASCQSTRRLSCPRLEVWYLNVRGGGRTRWHKLPPREKGAQRAGTVAGARPDDARWRSRRRLEQFTVRILLGGSFNGGLDCTIAPVRRIRCYGARRMSWIFRTRQGELGRRTENRSRSGRLTSRIPTGLWVSVQHSNANGQSVSRLHRRTSNPSTRFDRSRHRHDCTR